MSDIRPVAGALEIWENPAGIAKMIQQWDESESKAEQDRLMAKMIGVARCVADLGCGAGALVPLLYYVESYHGFDISKKMIEIATERHRGLPFVRFYQCDVFKESSNDIFDVAVLYDVAVHQEHPIAAVRRVLETWNARRYLCTLLVGTKAECLFASTVVSIGAFERFLCDELGHGWTIRYHRQSLGSFDWIVLDISR